MRTNAKGRLIVFEGVDAAGKTTLCDALYEQLLRSNSPVQRYHFPGKTAGTLGELVYRIHLHHKDEFNIPEVNQCSLQLLHIAAHIDCIEAVIKRAVNEGVWVILDRFWWSTYVYGLDDGVSAESLKLMIQLEKQAWGQLMPDLLLLIDTYMPLRSDESNCEAWQRKRKLYTELLHDESGSYPCKTITTERGDEARRRASDEILRLVNH